MSEFTEFQEHYFATAKKLYPELDGHLFSSRIHSGLISQHCLTLSKDILRQAEECVSQIFTARSHPEYLQAILSSTHESELYSDPGNNSIMMSYDFHIDSNQNLKLIEINTNAAFMLLGLILYKTHNKALPISFDETTLHENILNEIELCLGHQKLIQPTIIDENPTEQKLWVEFLMFKTWLERWGYDAKICDYRDIDLKTTNFIYNRYCDFYLSDKTSQKLKQAFESRKVCFSPNPYEYHLLANKSRLQALEKYAPNYILKTQDLTPEKAENLWSNRKNLFFKPKTSYGSKQSYRGEKISRKLFGNLINEGFIAQEFCPPPEVSLSTPEGSKDFKYDLRFYAYQGQLQGVLARCYQGQVTNSQTPWGGFAIVQFED